MLTGLRRIVARMSYLLGAFAFVLLVAPAIAANDDVAASPPGVAASPAEPIVAAARPDASPQAPTAVGPDLGPGFARLPGHVLRQLSDATPVGEGSAASEPAHGSQRIPLTLVLRRDHESEFYQYLHAVYDPTSPQYRKFLPARVIAARFGPTAERYRELTAYLKGQGFRVVGRSKNRMTLTVSGTRRQIERTFDAGVRDYRLAGRDFYANAYDPRLPRKYAAYVTDISGLSNLAVPQPTKQSNPALWGAICGGGPGISSDFLAEGETAGLGVAYNLVQTYVSRAPAAALSTYSGFAQFGPYGSILFFAALEWQALCLIDSMASWDGPIYPTAKIYNSFMLRAGVGSTRQTNNQISTMGTDSADGTGQTIGLLEFDTYPTSDVADYLSLTQLSTANLANLSETKVNGGASAGANQDEVLLDIDTVMSIAPGAKVVVYDAPFTGHAADYSALFNAMINGGVSVISNSWSSCEDQVSLADAQGIDQVLQAAAAGGISVFNGSGDTGSTCLDGAANTIGVPADSPNATAVGGTTLKLGAGFTYGSETWWNGSAASPPGGQGGFGVSRFFNRPTYQNGLSGNAMRSIPDVAIDADPATGMVICQASGGGCPAPASYGGTSVATPEWAAYAALLNEAVGHNLGALNLQLYPLAGSPGFQSAAALASDFTHVGLGSPNIDLLYLALTGQQVGAPSAANSAVVSLVPYQSLQTNGNAAGAESSVPADGANLGGILVQLFDANGNAVSGKTVTLKSSDASIAISPASAVTSVANGAAVFTFKSTSVTQPTFTATDVTDGITLASTASLSFVPPAAAGGGITANPPTVTADGQSGATVTVTLTDSLNRPSPGKTVTISDGGAHATITGPTPGVTNASGQIQFTVTDQVSEAVTFTAVDVTDNDVPVPGTATVTYSGSTSTACGVGVTATAGSGFSITPFITGLPAAPTVFVQNVNVGCPGAENPVFTSAGSTLAGDFLTGGLYQTGQSGGAVSSTNVVATFGPSFANLTYGKDGSLYATTGTSSAQLVQLDPATGAVLRTVATGLVCPTGLAVDPLSGDLFFDDDCTGAGLDDPSIYRVIDPAKSDASQPTSVAVYATLPTSPNGGMAFAPNGTLYAVTGYINNPNAAVEQISGTNSPTATVTAVSGVTSDFAVAVGATNPDGSAQTLIVEPAGNLTEVPIASPGAGTLLATGSPGVGVTGPDGCLYSAHYDTVYRLASSSGTCHFNPTSPAPSMNLTPAAVAPNPAQGTPVTLTATLHNVSPIAGVPVRFVVSGANPQTRLVDTDANGNAAFTYAALSAGADAVAASSTASGKVLATNPVKITWTAGKHGTFLALNSSPQAGTVNQPVTVVASLSDISVTPIAPLGGQSIVFTLGTSTCTAVTNGSGLASCAVTPAQVGVGTLTASFAGGAAAAATRSVAFNVSPAVAGAPPAPTVTIGVNPPSITQGSGATLTWSSTNATSCSASGAWSGAEPTSGTLAVNGASVGSFTYTLTCLGAGSTSATAGATLMVTTPVQSAPVVKWATPQAITYGEKLGSAQLDATANVAGTFKYSPAAGTVLPAGKHTLSVTFTPSNKAYSSVTSTVTLQVNQAKPLVLWLPLPLWYPAPLTFWQLDAIALDPAHFCLPLEGRFTYTPKAGTVLQPGAHELSAVFTPVDPNYQAVTVHATVEVFKSAWH
ncbi:MAG TPA: protease pro-enzyme activation domain-containing protein [Steroidobacteraceae bacterium]|jgi:hypothetical protein|nr:protease pro-enzyme activation domain-containing protein [Steroidobacteraceae bacterium]